MTEQRARLIHLSLSIAIVVALLYRQHLMVLNEDVIWLLVQAGRLLDGGRFGVDFIEVNTPPALLLYLPAALLQRVAGLSMPMAHLTATSALMAGLVAATLAILRPTLALRGASHALWPIGQAVAIAFVLQAYHFGQRDCIVILLLLPFLALQTVRDKGESPSDWLQTLAGVLAALAIGVKPHYLPLLGLLFILRWARSGFWRSLSAPDIRNLVLAAIALILLSLTFFPEWLSMARFAWRFYLPEGRSIGNLVTDLAEQRWPIFAVLLIALALWCRLPRLAPLRPFVSYLLLAAPCLLFAYLLQDRGYAYHLIPFELVVELAALLAILSILPSARFAAIPAIAVSAVLLGLSLLGIGAVLSSGLMAADIIRHPVVSAIRAFDRGQGMAIFDMDNTPAIFAAPLADTKIAARTQNLWLLKSAVAKLATTDSDIAARDLEIVEAGMITDLARFRPDVVLVNPDLRLANGSDTLSHLKRRSGFSTIWDGYHLAQAGVLTGAAGGRIVDIYVLSR